MTTTVPSWQVAAAGVVAVACVVVPLASGQPPLQITAAGLGGLVAAYFMRGRDRPRRDVAIGMAAFVVVGLVAGVQTHPYVALAWCGLMPAGYVLRGVWEAGRDPATLHAPWTGWRGWLALLGIIGLMVAGLVYLAMTVRTWQDLLIRGGPVLAVQIAALVGAVIVLGRRGWLRRSSRRWSADAEARLRTAVAGIRHERDVAQGARATGASDRALAAAADHAELASLYLESGPRLEAVREVELLVALADEDGWEPSAPLTQQVRGLSRIVRRGVRLRRNVDTEINRQ